MASGSGLLTPVGEASRQGTQLRGGGGEGVTAGKRCLLSGREGSLKSIISNDGQEKGVAERVRRLQQCGLSAPLPSMPQVHSFIPQILCTPLYAWRYLGSWKYTGDKGPNP